VSLDGVHFPEMPPLPAAPDDQWPDGDPAVAALAEDLRIVASGPAPEPRPGLVAVMAGARAVLPAPQPRRPKMLVKTVLGSLAAKVALGVGVAAASVTAVGATGVLPDQAQHAVASVVGATTPFVLPDPSTERPRTVDDPAESPTTTVAGVVGAGGVGTGTVGTGTVGDDPAGEDRADNHGACVSAAAKDRSGTGSHGKTVSSVARSDCGKVPTTSTTLVPTSTTVPGNSTTSSTSTSTTVAGASRVSNAGPGSADSGKGNGSDKAKDDGSKAGNGKGNDGSGSSSAKG
jgi:hypothetical protein